MATLLLRLAAPLQSWGDESKYDIRQTRLEPSKSGVIGLLSAALGLRRDSEEIPLLSQSLRMGVRIDMPGRVIRDYHTAKAPNTTLYVTYRYYLSDACFLVGLESEDNDLLERLACALSEPCFPLFLGRRSCPPTLPLCLGVRSVSLNEALQTEPWLAPEWFRRKMPEPRLRVVMESRKGMPAWHNLRDEPVSFSPVHRRYAPRGVEPEQIVHPCEQTHDPMAGL